MIMSTRVGRLGGLREDWCDAFQPFNHKGWEEWEILNHIIIIIIIYYI